jgi:hypothetical protein
MDEEQRLIVSMLLIGLLFVALMFDKISFDQLSLCISSYLGGILFPTTRVIEALKE